MGVDATSMVILPLNRCLDVSIPTMGVFNLEAGSAALAWVFMGVFGSAKRLQNAPAKPPDNE